MMAKKLIGFLLVFSFIVSNLNSDEIPLKGKDIISPILLASGSAFGIGGAILITTGFSAGSEKDTLIGVGSGLMGGAILLLYLGFTIGDGQMDYSKVSPEPSKTSFEFSDMIGVHINL